MFVSLFFIFTTLRLLCANERNEEIHSRTGRSILMYLPFSWRSSQNVFWSLASALAERGHNVTMVLPTSTKQPETGSDEGVVTNNAVHVIWVRYNNSMPSLSASTLSQRTGGSESSKLFWELVTHYKRLKAVSNNIWPCHHAALMHPEIRSFLHADKTSFDLVIVPAWYNEIGYFLAQKLNAPLILLMSANTNWILTAAMGYFDNPTFVNSVPDSRSQYEMPNLFSRLTSLALFNAFGAIKKLIWTNIQEEVLRELGYEDVDLLLFERNASFGMYFTHYIFDAVRPTLPNTVDIGFIHCRPARKLHSGLLSWFDEDDRDVVYIAFGSVLNFDKINETVKKAFSGAFMDTRYRFVLKSYAYHSNQTNVKTCRWCPQQDILGHPKTALFISHGGFMSLQEAIYHGVPILFLPLSSFDGLPNARRAERQGYGVYLNVSLDQSADEMRSHLSYTINMMLDRNSNYTLVAKQLGELIRDDIQTPGEKAVFWSEYVMRHAGSDHMKSPSRNVPFFYFFHVDIFMCFAVTLFLFLYITYTFIRFLLTVAFRITLRIISCVKCKKREKHGKED